MPIKFHEGSEEAFHIYNKHVSYIICIMENEQIENLYYGKRLSAIKRISVIFTRRVCVL